MATTTKGRKLALCAKCGQWCHEGEALADQHVLDFDGTLDYIALAHRDCARRWVEKHGQPTTYRLGPWTWDED